MVFARSPRSDWAAGARRRGLARRERAGGAGGRDSWFADRAAAGAPTSTPQNLVEINGASDEADPAISADGRELFFATTRAGSSEIGYAWRTCLSP